MRNLALAILAGAILTALTLVPFLGNHAPPAAGREVPAKPSREIADSGPRVAVEPRVKHEAEDKFWDGEFQKELEASGIRIEALDARSRAVLRQSWQACQDNGIAADSVCVSDTAPAAPFLLIFERSKTYEAELMAEALKEAAIAFFRVFTAEFGELFDGASLAKTQVCPVYVFESRARYLDVRRVPDWYGGDFSSRANRISLYKDSPDLYETLFHLLTHAVLHQAWLRKGNELASLTDTEMAWFSEGLSAYMENFKRDVQGGFLLGQPAPDHLPFVRKMLLSGKALKLPELMGITCRALHDPDKGRNWRAQVTAQSWALVYFLNKAAEGKYREKFRQYFTREIEGKGGLESAKECLGDLEALDLEVAEFYRAFK